MTSLMDVGSQGEADREFAEFVAARWAHLVRAAMLLGCSMHEAEDLTQATMERCYRAWPRVQAAASRDAYVSRVLLNTHRASRRRRWWGERPTAIFPEVSVHDPTEAVAGVAAVEQALGRLSADQRAVVVLRFWSHLTVPEIGSALGVPTGTVKSRLSRAIAALGDDRDIASLVEESPHG